ncbi:MAG: hypothetical protein GX781_01220 [Clostridiales bacterium]|nr:hypothetical protein [Clostridiales bacterium]
MKRLLAFFLICMLLLPNLAVFAETTETKVFDYKILENFPGYEYNKFDKTWDYKSTYLTDELDAGFRLELTGTQTEVTGVSMVIITLERTPADLAIFVDDKLYTYSNFANTYNSDNARTMLLGYVGKNMIKYMATAKRIEFQIACRTGNPIQHIITLQKFQEVITMCNNLMNLGTLDFIDDSNDKTIDETFEAAVE